MEATSLKEHEYNVTKLDSGEYLKVSAIYGANASGKTNVLQELGKGFQKNELGEYSKNDVNIFDKVTSKGKLHTAIKIANIWKN